MARLFHANVCLSALPHPLCFLSCPQLGALWPDYYRGAWHPFSLLDYRTAHEKTGAFAGCCCLHCARFPSRQLSSHDSHGNAGYHLNALVCVAPCFISRKTPHRPCRRASHGGRYTPRVCPTDLYFLAARSLCGQAVVVNRL